MTSIDQINAAEANLARQTDWIGRHDSRTAFVTGIAIGMLGVVCSACAKVNAWDTLTIVVFGCSGVLLGLSLFFIYRSQYPQVESPNSSLIFFGSIAGMKFDEFRNKSLNVTETSYLEDLLFQIHINSVLLKKKFSCLKIALVLLLLSVIPWITALFISRAFFG